jgi:hypothetical protein
MRPLPFSVYVVTAIVLLNMVVALSNAPGLLIATLLLTGPLLMVWMVWQVLHDQTQKIPELGEGEDWGYQDRLDLRPGGPEVGP